MIKAIRRGVLLGLQLASYLMHGWGVLPGCFSKPSGSKILVKSPGVPTGPLGGIS